MTASTTEQRVTLMWTCPAQPVHNGPTPAWVWNGTQAMRDWWPDCDKCTPSLVGPDAEHWEIAWHTDRQRFDIVRSPRHPDRVRERLNNAAPDLLAVCHAILTRWELEDPSAMFPAHALRGQLQAAITAATGEK